VLPNTALLGTRKAGFQGLLQLVHLRNGVPRNRLLPEYHSDREARAVFGLQARIQAVWSALPCQAWIQRAFECLDACMAEPLLLLSLLGQESPLECHWNPLFRRYVLSV